MNRDWKLADRTTHPLPPASNLLAQHPTSRQSRGNRDDHRRHHPTCDAPQGILRETAAQAGATDHYQLGHQLAVLFEGALALATSLNDTSALLHARSAAAVLFEAGTA